MYDNTGLVLPPSEPAISIITNTVKPQSNCGTRAESDYPGENRADYYFVLGRSSDPATTHTLHLPRALPAVSVGSFSLNKEINIAVTVPLYS